MLLGPIYEQDFVDGSFGFRPGRGAHQALERLWKRTMDSSGGWILEVDISKFFDTLDHGHLREFVKRRVHDGVLLRLIGKWLNAGVMEDGQISHPDSGSPQGGVISPLLANVFLHYVLDVWVQEEVLPRLAGKAYLIRYADDFVIGVTEERDARRVMDVLPKAIRPVRPETPPDQDAVDSVPETQRQGQVIRASGELRPAGVHSLLGPVIAWELGGEAQDIGQSAEPGVAHHKPMVQREPA